MRDTLERLCGSFIENREAVKTAFRMESEYIYPVCANVFCARGVAADSERIAACKRLVKENAGMFSSFRGTVFAPVACMLSLEEEPAARMERAMGCYRLLKERFMGSNYLALAAYLVASMTRDDAEAAERAARGRAIYEGMKGEHPFLTGSEDAVFAVLLAFSEQEDAALIAGMEECYARIRERFPSRNAAQSASHVLAMAQGDSGEKVARMERLYDRLLEAGRRFGREYELAVLAAASVLEADEEALAADILAVDEFLSRQKGYGGVFGIEKKRRLMHAAMIAADEYAPHGAMDTAALAGTISIIAAQQAAMCAVIAASAASTAAASSHS